MNTCGGKYTDCKVKTTTNTVESQGVYFATSKEYCPGIKDFTASYIYQRSSIRRDYCFLEKINNGQIIVEGGCLKGEKVFYQCVDADEDCYNFYNQGYNILFPEQRGTGESEGTWITMGIKEQQDLNGWINYIIEKDVDSQIILFGVSMGAATVLLSTGGDLPENVVLAIADCAYTSVTDEFSYLMDYYAGLPSFPFLSAAEAVCNLTCDLSIYDGNVIESVKKSTTPTLFIHGSADDFVPFYMLDELYSAHPGNKEKLVIEGAEHARSSSINPELYWQTVWEFVGKYI